MYETDGSRKNKNKVLEVGMMSATFRHVRNAYLQYVWPLAAQRYVAHPSAARIAHSFAHQYQCLAETILAIYHVRLHKHVICKNN